MPLDSLCVMSLARELDTRASGAHVEKIHQPSGDTVVFALRAKDGGGKLLFCGGTGSARVHFTESRFENPDVPPMFCMLLRKHLLGARVVSVTQPGLERIIDVKFDASDPMGDRCERHIIAELISAAANVILTDGEGRIIDCMRRISGDMSGKRRLLPGLFYRMPPAQEKRDPFSAAKDEIMNVLNDDTGRPVEKVLLSGFTGLSPLICREIAFRAYGDTSVSISETSDKGAGAAAELKRILDDVSSEKTVPTLLSEKDGRPRDFSFTGIGQYGAVLDVTYTDSFSGLLDAFYTRRDKADKLRTRSQTILKTAKNARDRLTRKLAAQKTELLQTRDREYLRQCGDIIMANLGVIRKGDTSLTAEDFYADEGATRTIKLDPAKSAQQNAAKYYKDVARAKNAEKFLTEQITNGERELEYLEAVVGEIERASDENDLRVIRQALEDAGYIKKQQTGKKIKRPTVKPMRFISSAGIEIRAGRTGTQNDELTKSAQRTDIWLHTQKIHGSHVIISCCGAEPDETTLMEAAGIAAYYSQARESSGVPVDYTMVKYVKKPSGAKPGMVIYTDYKTLFVTPDEKEIEKLRDAR